MKQIKYNYLTMHNSNYKNFLFGITISCLIIYPSPVFAYIDPASGSAIVSAIIGLFVALGMTIKSYWYKLKSLFKKQK
jgi:hypothetical protein